MSVNTLYNIHKRQIERSNDILDQRKKISEDLKNNCHQWSKLLLDYFEESILIGQERGKDAALRHIDILILDIHNLDYWSLKADSTLLSFLDEDKRFRNFVNSCMNFYDSALDIKPIVYGSLQNHKNEYISIHDSDIKVVIATYRSKIEQMLTSVMQNYHAIQIIVPT